MCLLDAFCSGPMPLVMAIVTGHLIRTGKGGLLFKSCAVFLLLCGVFSEKTCHSDPCGQLGRSTNLQVPCVMGAINSLLDREVYDWGPKISKDAQSIRYMFGACASNIWRICLTFVQCAFCAWWFWVSYHYIKLSISFSGVSVYAMLWALRVETIEPYPNSEASALDCRFAIECHFTHRWPGVGRTVWTCRFILFLWIQLLPV